MLIYNMLFLLQLKESDPTWTYRGPSRTSLCFSTRRLDRRKSL